MKASSQGFTLLELMVAIAIFGIISTAAYKLFISVTGAREVTQSVLSELDKVQRAEVILEKDLMQIVGRPVRDNAGIIQPALKSPAVNGALIEFTRMGWDNPLQLTRSTLQRVAYSVEGSELIRYYWSMLDRAPDASPIRQKVLADVKSARFRFLDNNKRWVNQWPSNVQLPGASPSPSPSPSNGLSQIPAAIELTVIHEKKGSMITLVPLSTYKPEAVNAGQEGAESDLNSSQSSPANPAQLPPGGFNGY
ncbi:type II secretion system minor pseudopilin GspJ [Endozoicomonas ascidiicola]|uniref:type II secretion system minor pseudopilin GspJ n=1 Tax=Endozoicomonas ascidiicola TaxID=1698521 RepID=UPI0008312330|nr:type II secretion system minor pseudopilin GspJ [Endozoicomonas ascidiicola]